MTFPYAGYSWSFNHHMGRVNSRELFTLLELAYKFRKYPNYRELINQALVTKEIFTPNIRTDSGQVDAWRDYQQILPDLVKEDLNLFWFLVIEFNCQVGNMIIFQLI